MFSLINVLAEISFERFLQALPYVGYGMLGIFIVIGAIILIMTFMGWAEDKVAKNKNSNNENQE